MAQFFSIHPDNPQARLLHDAAALLKGGGILAVPTDTCYSLVCQLDDKAAATTMRQIRELDAKQLLSLLCRDLSELAAYARVDNTQYRLLKHGTPGPFTFVLEASKEVPTRLSQPGRRTIGLRIPDHKALQGLLAAHGAPLLATTLTLPGDDQPLHDAEEVRDRLGKTIAGVIESGSCPGVPSTIVDLTGATPQILRVGRGDPAVLGL